MRGGSPVLRALAGAALFLSALAGSSGAAGGGGTTTGEFLALPQGARPIGMGGAFAALADDANSLWWNPAGLARARIKEISASHTRYIEDIVSEFGAFVLPLSPKAGTLGASFTHYNIPGLTSYDASKNASGKITANAWAASIAYGRYLAPNISAGVNVKMVNQKFHTESGRGFAADFGAQYKHPASGFGAGFSAQNIGGSARLGEDTSSLPRMFRGGISYTPPNFKKLTFALDEEKPNDEDPKAHVGAEWKVNNAFTFRSGWEQLRDLGGGAGLSMGLRYITMLGAPSGWAGEETPWWERKSAETDTLVKPDGAYFVFADYAFVSLGSFGDTHRFTLGVKF